MIRKLGVLALLIIFTGCSKFATQKPTVFYNPEFAGSGGDELVPKTDKPSNDCRTNKEFDACVLYKNPVAQKGSIATATEINGLLSYGIKIRGLASAELGNGHVQILTLHTARLNPSRTDQLKSQYSETESYVEQVMAYYWSNRVFEYLGARLGLERLPLNSLKIYVDDSFTGYSTAGQSVSLAKKAGEIPKALSGEIVVNLLGQAIAYNLSGGKSFDLHSSAQHKFCDLNPKGCCATDLGCSAALNSAFGDYLAGVMFPELPVLGESISGDVAGQNICGLARDLAKLSTQTRSSVYSACPATSTGKVALEGAWYASLWWKVRKRAEAIEPGSSRDIDILYFEHARSWTVAATFQDAKQNALTLATSYKGGKYWALLESVFSAAQL